MNQPQPHSLNFSPLINDIEKGVIKIPQFQRDFVWTKEKSAKLLDSIIKGYPIGTFILWKTRESLRSVRNIGGAELPQPPVGELVNYVLDGQQRLTSLFASIQGLSVERSTKPDDFAKIYVDLDASGADDIVILDVSGKTQYSYIRLVDLLRGGLTLLAEYPTKYHIMLEDYKNRFQTYQFSIIALAESPIDVATDVFTRLNVGGTPLTVFEIMVAKTFDPDSGFDLAEKCDELRGDLAEADYETISETTILQTISTLITKECSKKVILKLQKAKVINIWENVREAIRASVDFFRNVYRIPVSKLLPYNALLVPFAYFFHKHPQKPNKIQKNAWRISFGEHP